MSKELIEQIIGHALELMVESGVDKTALGKFALGAHSKMASLMEEQGNPQEFSLEDIIQSTVLRTMQVAPPSNAGKEVAFDSHASMRRSNAEQEFERINITVNGKRSSVTIDRQLVIAIRASTGSARKANKLIGSVAKTLGETQEWASPQVNRSALLNAKLHEQFFTNLHVIGQQLQ